MCRILFLVHRAAISSENRQILTRERSQRGKVVRDVEEIDSGERRSETQNSGDSSFSFSLSLSLSLSLSRLIKLAKSRSGHNIPTRQKSLLLCGPLARLLL